MGCWRTKMEDWLKTKLYNLHPCNLYHYRMHAAKLFSHVELIQYDLAEVISTTYL